MKPRPKSKSKGLKQVKFSEIRKLTEASDLTFDELAIITHFLQSNESATRNALTLKAKPLLDRLGIKSLRPAEIKWDIPVPPTPINSSKFTFIDLFAGIGGMRAALQSIGGRCVYSSEWEDRAQETYFENFGEVPFGDINSADNRDQIPKHNVLVAGFPCQAFSIAGKRGGFEDTRGTLFFQVAKILEATRPDAFLLENVKGLLSHDSKRTIQTILRVLREELNYYVPDPEILNARNFGVPQNRERVFIVGFKTKAAMNRFTYPKPSKKSITISTIMETSVVSVKYYMSTQYLQTLRRHRRRHEEKGNGFGYQIIGNDQVSNAIVVGGMGRERNLVIDHRLKNFTPITHIKGQVNREGIRRMTPKEWSRLQGFPDNFIIHSSDSQAYKQFGNSVAVPVVAAVGKQIMDALWPK